MDHWRKPSLLFELSSTTKRKALSGLGVGVGAFLLILTLVLYVGATTSSSSSAAAAAALFSWFSSARSDAEPSKVGSFSLGKEGAAVSESEKAPAPAPVPAGHSSNSSSPATDRFDVYKAHSGAPERAQDNATNNDTSAGVGWKLQHEKDGIGSSSGIREDSGKTQSERTANSEDEDEDEDEEERTLGNKDGFGDKKLRHQSTQLDIQGGNSSHGSGDEEAVKLGERTEVGFKQIGGLSRKCDVFSGRWVRDDNYFPYYPGGSCPYLDDDFNCYKNGRPDDEFLKWRWQPYGCNIPR